MNFPAIIIEHPHQTPAKAYAVYTLEELLTIACNDYEQSDGSETEPTDAETAIAYLGHDLNGITVLESAEEAKAYLERCESTDQRTRGHNPGMSVTRKVAVELGWIAEAK